MRIRGQHSGECKGEELLQNQNPKRLRDGGNVRDSNLEILMAA